MQPLLALIFDWDGTLVDSYDADLAAYILMFRDFGIPWGARELDLHYSPNWHKIYQAAGIPRREWPRADRLWSRYYLRQSARLIPGARRTLNWAACRWPLGLVTSGNRRRVHRQLKLLDTFRLFRARVCAEDAPERKPHPLPLELALKKLRVPPHSALYVGDAPEDIEMARAAGVPAIGVKGPFPTHHKLKKSRPLLLLDHISQLPAALSRLHLT